MSLDWGKDWHPQILQMGMQNSTTPMKENLVTSNRMIYALNIIKKETFHKIKNELRWIKLIAYPVGRKNNYFQVTWHNPWYYDGTTFVGYISYRDTEL